MTTVDPKPTATTLRALSTANPMSRAAFGTTWAMLLLGCGLPLWALGKIGALETSIRFMDELWAWAWALTGLAIGWWASARRVVELGGSRVVSLLYLIPVVNCWLVFCLFFSTEHTWRQSFRMGRMDPFGNIVAVDPHRLLRPRAPFAYILAALASAAVFGGHVAVIALLRLDQGSGLLVVLLTLFVIGSVAALVLGLQRASTVGESVLVALVGLSAGVAVFIGLQVPELALGAYFSVLVLPLAAPIWIFYLFLMAVSALPISGGAALVVALQWRRLHRSAEFIEATSQFPESAADDD